MAVKKVKTTVTLTILKEWSVDGVNYFRVKFSADRWETETVITQDPRTFEIREPSRFVQNSDKDHTEIIAGTPFWSMLNALLRTEDRSIQFDILVSQKNKINYHLEITANSTEHMQVHSIITDRKNFTFDELMEDSNRIPTTSGWWFLAKDAINAHDDIQSRVVCD